MASRWSLKNLKDAANAIRANHTNGAFYFYSGTQPASAQSAPTGTLVAVATKDGTARVPGTPAGGCTMDAAVASGDDAVLNKPTGELWQLASVAAGTIGWCRYVGNAADTEAADPTGLLARYDMAVSTASGAGEVKLDKVTYAAAGELGNIVSGTITFSNALQPA